MNKSSLKSNVIWNTIGTVFYQGCLWLITVLVVRLSNDYSNSGSLAFAMSIGNITFALGTYNMRTYQVADTEGRYTPRNYVAFRCVTMAISAIACGLYAVVIAPTTSTLLVSLVYILFKLDETFANVFYAIDQKRMRLDIAGKSMLVRGIICVTAFSASMLLTRSLTISVLCMYIGCVAITFAFDIPNTKRIEHSIIPQIERQQVKALLVECLPSVSALIVSTFIVSSARQYYGVVYGENNLGIYASVATPCVIIQVLAQNIYTPFLGPIAEVFNTGHRIDARKDFCKLVYGVMAIGLVISSILALASKPLLIFLYGESISPYTWLLGPVLIVTTEAACTALITDALVIFGKLRTTLAVNLSALLVTLAIIVPSCSCWDMNGVSISLICGFSVAIAIGITAVLKATKD